MQLNTACITVLIVSCYILINFSSTSKAFRDWVFIELYNKIVLLSMQIMVYIIAKKTAAIIAQY